MTQLAASVNSTDELWTLDALPTTPLVQVQSELVEVRAMFPEHVYLPTNETIPPKIRVRRAQGGTSPASHANGTALTAVYSESAGGGGGGALTVDNQSDPPAEVTTLIAPGATIDGDEATLANFIEGDAAAAGDGATVVAHNAGGSIAGVVDISGGSGLAGKSGGGVNINGGDGDAGADSGARIIIEGGGGGADGRIEVIGDEVTFTIASAPQVPASPTEQDIVDALLALGLVTQAP